MWRGKKWLCPFINLALIWKCLVKVYERPGQCRGLSILKCFFYFCCIFAPPLLEHLETRCLCERSACARNLLYFEICGLYSMEALVKEKKKKRKIMRLGVMTPGARARPAAKDQSAVAGLRKLNAFFLSPTCSVRTPADHWPRAHNRYVDNVVS